MPLDHSGFEAALQEAGVREHGKYALRPAFWSEVDPSHAFYTPEEQAHNNPGFDVLSRPAEGAGIRIEVKARIEGSDTFTITRTEVLTALNAAPDHRLALVRVSASGPQHDEVCYIGNAFEGVEPAWLTDFDVVSQNLSWNDWWARGGEPF